MVTSDLELIEEIFYKKFSHFAARKAFFNKLFLFPEGLEFPRVVNRKILNDRFRKKEIIYGKIRSKNAIYRKYKIYRRPYLDELMIHRTF